MAQLSSISRRSFVAGLGAFAVVAATAGLTANAKDGVSSAADKSGAADKSSQADKTGALSVADGGPAPVDQEIPEATGDKTITVAATATPHAEILNGPVKTALEAKGWKLDVREFTDYVLPNTSTEDGEVDANYFQHITYLKNFNKEQGTHLVSVGGVHFEPFGLYAGKTSSLDALADGAQVAVPNDVTNEARALLLLQQEGLLKLKDGVGIEATTNDIAENPKNIQFVEVEAAAVSTVLADVDIAAINGNYALDAGYTIADALAVEADDSVAAQAYVNVLTVKEGNEATDKTKALVNATFTSAVRTFIKDTYNGAVVALF